MFESCRTGSNSVLLWLEDLARPGGSLVWADAVAKLDRRIAKGLLYWGFGYDAGCVERAFDADDAKDEG